MVTVGDLPNHAHAGAIPAEKPDDDELDDVVERAIETSTEQGVPVPDSDVVKKLDDCATDILRQLCGPTKHITFYPRPWAPMIVAPSTFLLQAGVPGLCATLHAISVS
ncbi:hypothetical protein H4Q26_004243 [Puccinia striiformis f. sp. tritici PST-130]|nr:hypothetical protein H4Q26_004243 [Puccinia striiformis f. sp. tritici PST-130]